MSGTSFGVGMPFANPASPQSPWGLQGIQGPGINPFGAQPLQQIVQLLQSVPQQLHQLQELASMEQQQLQQLQQLVQIIPAQLAQLHQLIQFVPQQIQQMQQPFSQGLGAGVLGTSPLGILPQTFGAQPGYLM